METSPSIDLGEVTDKGSINQRAVLKHRAALVATLYEGADPAVLLPSKTTAPSEPSHAGS
jgi:feruloyl-CoA synthase